MPQRCPMGELFQFARHLIAWIGMSRIEIGPMGVVLLKFAELSGSIEMDTLLQTGPIELYSDACANEA